VRNAFHCEEGKAVKVEELVAGLLETGTDRLAAEFPLAQKPDGRLLYRLAVWGMDLELTRLGRR
jgi:hypothetical protein